MSDANPGYYGSHEFRYRATNGIFPRKGEVIYGEIVGFTTSDTPIMSRQSLDVLKDKAAEKAYGKTITYTYGCEEGECVFHVYRITMVNEDAQMVELSWNQMVARCKELGLTHVTPLDTFIYDGDKEALLKRVQALVDGESGVETLPSTLDKRHIREGVVVRYESPDGTDWCKSKSRAFGLLEGYLKEKEEYIDTEEAS